MKIAFIGQQEDGGRLGAYANQVAKKMVEKGHEVFVYVRGFSKTPNIAEGAGVKMVNFPGSGKDKKSFSRLEISPLLHVLFKKFDVIHCGPSVPDITIWLLSKIKRNAVIFKTFYGGESQSYKFAQGIMVNSEEILAQIPEKYRKKVTLIHLLLAVKKRMNKYNISQWGIREKRYALFCGRIEEKSMLHELIEAFKKLEDTCKLPNNFKLVIAGEFGNSSDFEYLEKLRNISKDRKNIILIKGKSESARADLMSEAFIYISPQVSGAPVSRFISAMSAGIPIIASADDSNRSILGDAALYFSNKEKESLVEKMAFLLNRPDEAKRMGEIAKKKALNEYGWDMVAEKTLAAYEVIIKNKREINERNN